MEKQIIVISAVWCPSCLILKKNLKKLKEKYNINYTMLDYDLDDTEVEKYNIGDKLPVMIVDDKRLIGEKSYEEIEEFLKDCEVLWKKYYDV